MFETPPLLPVRGFAQCHHTWASSPIKNSTSTSEARIVNGTVRVRTTAAAFFARSAIRCIIIDTNLPIAALCCRLLTGTASNRRSPEKIAKVWNLPTPLSRESPSLEPGIWLEGNRIVIYYDAILFTLLETLERLYFMQFVFGEKICRNYNYIWTWSVVLTTSL